MKTTYSRYGGRTVTAVFGEMAERVRGRCASCRADPPAPVRAGRVTMTAALAENGRTGDTPDHGPVPRKLTMDSPVSPPLSAGRAALPYMGIKRTAPRDWTSAGTTARRRPRPNAFRANGISSPPPPGRYASSLLPPLSSPSLTDRL